MLNECIMTAKLIAHPLQYSQAVDVGTLKGVQADTIRILVWILAFMSFGYATLVQLSSSPPYHANLIEKG